MEKVGKKLTAKDFKVPNDSEWENKIQQWCEDILKTDLFKEDKEDKNKIESYCYSWRDCFNFLRDNLPDDISDDIPFLFEYAIESISYRMDVIILLDKKVIVLEFKATVTDKDIENEIEQLNNYIDGLKYRHDVTYKNKMTVEGFLVRTKDHGENINRIDCKILDWTNFNTEISKSINKAAAFVDIDNWINSDLTVAPSLAKMSKDTWVKYNTEQRKDEDTKEGYTRLDKTLSSINKIINDEQGKKAKSVILIDGVPGAGKTYLEFSIVFQT